MPPTQFEEIDRLASEFGFEKTLDYLDHNFRRQKDFFKLFEVLKMRCRHKLGLPLMYTEQPDDLSETQQKELEDGLLDACREVGTLLVRNGQIQEGWMYLQPVGDRQLNDKLIRSLKVDDENIDTLIEISVNQGAAPAYGYELLLKHYGTCNGITTYDTQVARFDRSAQREMAITLLHHLYGELLANVRYSLEQSGVDCGEETLGQILRDQPNLLQGGAHHIDTTHLASVMRIARQVESEKDLRLAADLAAYGIGLAEDFQYPGAPPFEDTYVDHQFYFRALLGEEIEAAIAHFKNKISTVDVHEFGSVAIESLIELLVRLNRNDEALEICISKLLGKHEPLGIAPSPFELATTPAQRQRLMDHYRSSDDILGYSVSRLQAIEN